MKTRDLEKLKADLLLLESLREKSEDEKASNAKLAQGIRDIPVKKMMDQVLHIRNDLLPRIKKKNGETSGDYLFFEEVANHLLYAIMVADRYDELMGRFTRSKVMQQLQLENITVLERELQKYCLLEELFLTDGLNNIAEGVKRRAEALLKAKK